VTRRVLGDAKRHPITKRTTAIETVTTAKKTKTPNEVVLVAETNICAELRSPKRQRETERKIVTEAIARREERRGRDRGNAGRGINEGFRVGIGIERDQRERHRETNPYPTNRIPANPAVTILPAAEVSHKCHHSQYTPSLFNHKSFDDNPNNHANNKESLLNPVFIIQLETADGVKTQTQTMQTDYPNIYM